jgi:sRNA-binding regulator protein Hfq
MVIKKNSEVKLERKSKKSDRDVGGADLFKSLLRADDTFAQFKSIVKGIKSKIDIEEISDEAVRLHSGRRSRNLYGTTPGPEKIIEAALQDSSYRSRMVEIRVKLVRYRDRLDVAIDATRQYLALNYPDMVKGLRTKAERGSVFDTYLRNGVRLHEELKSVISQLDDLVKDIDQTAYVYKTAVECLELLLHRNNDRKG